MATQIPIQSVATAPAGSPSVSQPVSSAPGVLTDGAPAQHGTATAQLAGPGHQAIWSKPEEAAGEFLHLSPPCARLPVIMAAKVPVRNFRVRNLLAMLPGEVIQTQWGHGEDLPLSSGDVQLAWTEFEVVDTRLAVRITRLA